MPKNLNVVWMLIVILGFVAILVFTAIQDTKEIVEKEGGINNYYASRQAWFDSLRVGRKFRPAYNYYVGRENAEFVTYEVYEGRIGRPGYICVTVKNGIIVEIIRR